MMSQSISVNGRTFEDRNGKLYLDGNEIVKNTVTANESVNKYIALGLFVGLIFGLLIGLLF